MAARYPNPKPQYVDTTGLPMSGGVLRFYVTSSSTPLAVYSDAALGSSLGTSITLNSRGEPPTSFFLSNVDYKVSLEDSSGNVLWTVDPVRASDFASFPIFKVGSGTPNGTQAGTAGSSGVLQSMYWDYTNSLLYACTSTGTTSTAVWTSLNPGSSATSIPPPQGYLTLTSATPIITGDVSAATAVYYTPFVGDFVPIYNGTTFAQTQFAELTLTLVASHAASQIYDVFSFFDTTTLRIGTGPAWSTVTAGAGARGTGAGTTQLTRLNGRLVNAQSMTVRNGSSTYTVAGNYGTYLGSIFMDGTNGQVSCHKTFGQSRKWGVWNAYNRQTIVLQMGDTTATWAYSTATIRQSNAAVGNTLAIFSGLAETPFQIRFSQNSTFTGGGATGFSCGVGVDSTTTYSGQVGKASNAAAGSNIQMATASHIVTSLLGMSAINALESGNGTATNTFAGGNDDMLMTATWMG